MVDSELLGTAAAQGDITRAPKEALLVARALSSADNARPSQDIDDVDILQIVSRLPPYRLRDAGVFRAARNRALLTVFVTLGGRREATMDLDRRDYLRGFRCPDGELSPAIALRPGKHAPPDQVSWKPIPEGEALVLDVYLAVAECELGAPMPASGPLFIPSLTKFDKHMTGGSASYMMGGPNGMLPKPLDPEAGGAAPARRGYSPQTLRRAALQLVRHGARAYCVEHDLNGDPECIAEVLLDHAELRADTMGYADIDTVQGRIRWSKVAIAVNWEMLTTDRGARRVPDVRRFKEALEVEKALAGELKREERELEQLAQARFEAVSSELVVELLVAFDRVRKIERSLAEIRETLRSLELDRETWRVLPDDAPDEKVDLKAVPPSLLVLVLHPRQDGVDADPYEMPGPGSRPDSARVQAPDAPFVRSHGTALLQVVKPSPLIEEPTREATGGRPLGAVRAACRGVLRLIGNAGFSRSRSSRSSQGRWRRRGGMRAGSCPTAMAIRAIRGNPAPTWWIAVSGYASAA